VAPPPPPIAGPAICEPLLLLSFPLSLPPPSPPVAAPAVCEPLLLPRRRWREQTFFNRKQ
jgi:hypothetical protein